MPPKVKTTKEDIINAAVDIARTYGTGAVNARTIAKELTCSTQPIFSNFKTMEELNLAIAERTTELFNEYLEKEIQNGEYPIYKASGMAYIKFAKEERELFKLLFMRDRLGEEIPENDKLSKKMEGIVINNTGLNEDEAKLFHLENWAYVHGIATMFATGFLNLEWELVSRMLSDSFLGLKKQYGLE